MNHFFADRLHEREFSVSSGGLGPATQRTSSSPGVQIPLSYITKKRSRSRTLQTRQEQYGITPDLVLHGWQSLIPALLELSHHANGASMTLLQAVRKTRDMNGTGANALMPGQLQTPPEVLDGWLYDLIVTVGTLPFDTSETGDRFAHAAAGRLQGIHEPDFDGNISAHSRNEAMICLEILCTKIWYERHKRLKKDDQIAESLLETLEFIYWECGIPNSLAMFWDNPPDLWHPAFEDARRHNYRQLYVIHEKNLLGALAQRIEEGVLALEERRNRFASRFQARLRKDMRNDISMSEHIELIQARYAIRQEDDLLERSTSRSASNE